MFKSGKDGNSGSQEKGDLGGKGGEQGSNLQFGQDTSENEWINVSKGDDGSSKNKL